MRYVPVYNIRENMVLGRNLYGKSGELLLSVGTCIRQNGIEKLKYLGYCGIYVEDGISKDIVIREVVPDPLRRRLINETRDIFGICQKKIGTFQMQKLLEEKLHGSTKNILLELINTISENRNMVLDLVDLKIYDEYVIYHSVNVCSLSLMLGERIGLDREMLYKLALAGLLHDIGRVFLGKDLFNKMDKLTTEEMNLMKQHSQLSFRFIKDLYGMTIHTNLGILQHHERLNGSGYPGGDKGDKITLFGRILGVADAYDALTSDRPYRNAMIPMEAIKTLLSGAGSLYDEHLVKELGEKIGHYPVGMCVELDNGVKGIVIENRMGAMDRPALRILGVESSEEWPVNIDLSRDRDYAERWIKGLAEA